jgi:signal transduction histidine kinase
VLHVISHNLRSPLVNIQGFSNELVRLCEEMQMKISTAQGGTLPARELAHAFEEEIPRALQFIRTGVTRLDALLSGFLRFSRLGQAALQIRTVDMDQVLAGTVQAARFQIEQAGAQVEVGPLPGCLGDAIHVGQVFANLLDNALKYRDPHRPLRVAVSGRIEGDRAIYAVADNGIGIAPEHQAKVFEMFRRLNPRAAPGEGLGLAIAQRIVERQQGRIWVESKPGQGATFFVSLPANPSRVSNS